MKWKFNDDDDESVQTTSFLHLTNATIVPYAYPSQLIKLKNKKKVGNTYVLDKKKAAHSPTTTYRTGKLNDETQVT